MKAIVRPGFLGVLIVVGLVRPVPADDPPASLVDFDAKLSVSAKDVTPAEYAKANPGLRTFEIRLPLSANIKVEEAQVESIVYKVRVPRPLEIVDFLPKTQLGSEMVGPYVVGEKTNDRTARVTSLDGGAQVGYKVLGAGIETRASGGLKDESNAETSSEVQFQVLPPKKSVVAAGTEDRGQTVYFELRPFSQTTLKGQREFVVLLVAPEKWDGVCVDLACSASLKTPAVTVVKTIRTAVYRGGDPASRRKYEAIADQTPGALILIPAHPLEPTAPQPAASGNAPEPAAAAATSHPALPDLLTLSKKYRILRQNNGLIKSGHLITYEDAVFKANGTWQGWQSFQGTGTIGSSLVRGRWSFKDGKLTVIAQEVSVYGWSFTRFIPCR